MVEQCVRTRQNATPKLVTYFEDDTFEDIDLMSYYKDKEEHEKRKEVEQSTAAPKSKPFKKRNRRRKRDPTKSVWYLDYVLDEYKAFRDKNHANGKVFIHLLLFIALREN